MRIYLDEINSNSLSQQGQSTFPQKKRIYLDELQPQDESRGEIISTLKDKPYDAGFKSINPIYNRPSELESAQWAAKHPILSSGLKGLGIASRAAVTSAGEMIRGGAKGMYVGLSLGEPRKTAEKFEKIVPKIPNLPQLKDESDKTWQTLGSLMPWLAGGSALKSLGIAGSMATMGGLSAAGRDESLGNIAKESIIAGAKGKLFDVFGRLGATYASNYLKGLVKARKITFEDARKLGATLANAVQGGIEAGFYGGNLQDYVREVGLGLYFGSRGDTPRYKISRAQRQSFLNRATDDYMKIFKWTPKEKSAIEVGRGEKIEDYMKLLAEEQLPIKQKKDGDRNVIDSTTAIEELSSRQEPIHEKINEILATDKTRRINLNNLRDRIARNILNSKKTAASIDADLKTLNNLIDSEIELRGEFVDGKTANDIKKGMWSESYNLLEPNKKDVARKIGHELKIEIENNYTDKRIKELNDLSGKYKTLQTLLEKANGRAVQGGVLQKRFAQLAGAMAGSKIPIAGTIGGWWVGGKVYEKLTDPSRISAEAIKKSKASKSFQKTFRRIMTKEGPQDISKIQYEGSEGLLPKPTEVPKLTFQESVALKEGESARGEGFEMTPYSTKEKTKKWREYQRTLDTLPKEYTAEADNYVKELWNDYFLNDKGQSINPAEFGKKLLDKLNESKSSFINIDSFRSAINSAREKVESELGIEKGEGLKINARPYYGRKDISDGGFIELVSKDNKIIGNAEFEIRQNGNDRRAVLPVIELSENMRGQKLGSKFLKLIENMAIERGANRITAQVVHAPDFFKSQGYVNIDPSNSSMVKVFNKEGIDNLKRLGLETSKLSLNNNNNNKLEELKKIISLRESAKDIPDKSVKFKYDEQIKKLAKDISTNDLEELILKRYEERADQDELNLLETIFDDNGKSIMSNYLGHKDTASKSKYSKYLNNKRGQVDFGSDKYKDEKIFKGYVDLTTKTLDKLKGRTSVSKQFIYDLTNQPDLKQSERELIRSVLDEYKTSDIPVQEFADKVKTQLLPLKTSDSLNKKTMKEMLGLTPQELEEMSRSDLNELRRQMPNDIFPEYESISLKPNERGLIKNYFERIYRSPIETQAGDVHFSESGIKDYFAHTRIEDLPGAVRRVIELQSDLFQKGRLEKEITGHKLTKLTADQQVKTRAKYLSPAERKEYIDLWESNDRRDPSYKFYEREGKMYEKDGVMYEKSIRFRELSQKADYAMIDEYRIKMKPLQSYENTWHERIIREEIKKAAQDGKTKLLFPTGETAMKVEGLSQKINLTEIQNFINSNKSGIVKAFDVPYNVVDTPQGEMVVLENFTTPETGLIGVPLETWNKRLKIIKEEYADYRLGDDSKKRYEDDSVFDIFLDDILDYTETLYDAKGEFDKNDPIYKFYEKDVAKYLKRIDPQVKTITDKQGVTWNEVSINKERAKMPVEAFGVIGGIIASALGGEAQAAPPKDEDAVKAILGEVGPYGFQGMLWVASTIRNRNKGLKGIYGQNNPNVVNKKYTKKQYEDAVKAWKLSSKKDYSLGAVNWFSDEDLKQSNVQKIIKDENLEFIARVGRNNFYRKKRSNK